MKRNAGSDLNHDNWDKEEEQEERGEFLTADKNIISQRKVITARRKPASSVSGVFKSFSGFTQNSNSLFNPKFTNDVVGDSNKEKHLNSLKALNQKFLDCISKHINENPICVLTPTLDDYRNHLTNIKSKYPLPLSPGHQSTNDVNPLNESSLANTSKPIPTFSFNPAPNMSFFQKEETKSSTAALLPEINPKTLFGADITKSSLFNTSFSSSTIDKPLPFSFNKESVANTGLSFAPVTTENNSLFKNGPINLFTPKEVASTEEEEYVPPVAEIREVKEADSVYDTKCCIYYQIDKEWKKRGVGFLFVKPISKGKFQLVIRADNSVANIILNVNINESIPMKTMDNNVSLVTMTDFVKKDEHSLTPLLIRVKTSEKAEELLAAMKNQL